METLKEVLRIADKRNLAVAIDIDTTTADIYPLMFYELNIRNAAAGRSTNYVPADLTKYDWSTVGSKWKGEMDLIYNHVWLNRSDEIGLLIDPSNS